MALVPIVETPRLVVRGHRPDDLADSVRLWQHPTTVRFIGGRPLGEEEVWLRLLRYWGSWATLGYGFWRIEHREGGAFVGEVGFHDLRRDTQPSFAGEPEVGWGLLPAFHGQGLAREALDAALAWGAVHITAPRTVCIIEPENSRSITLAQAVGFRRLDAIDYRGRTMELFGRPQPGRAA